MKFTTKKIVIETEIEIDIPAGATHYEEYMDNNSRIINFFKKQGKSWFLFSYDIEGWEMLETVLGFCIKPIKVIHE